MAPSTAIAGGGMAVRNINLGRRAGRREGAYPVREAASAGLSTGANPPDEGLRRGDLRRQISRVAGSIYLDRGHARPCGGGSGEQRGTLKPGGTDFRGTEEDGREGDDKL